MLDDVFVTIADQSLARHGTLLAEKICIKGLTTALFCAHTGELCRES